MSHYHVLGLELSMHVQQDYFNKFMHVRVREFALTLAATAFFRRPNILSTSWILTCGI